jgi:hypothetical protein
MITFWAYSLVLSGVVLFHLGEEMHWVLQMYDVSTMILFYVCKLFNLGAH